MNNIIKLKSNNGLTIHLKEIHNAPLVSHWVWYRVGSHDEIAGSTGISHWVEHMQFKGTQKFPAGILDKAVSRVGGVWNAFTYLDWTAYFETMPADEVDLAMQLESDRMLNSVFDSQEVESERTVVISEREGNENEPLFRLGEAVQSLAFERHPYRNEVIGSLQDLRTISRDSLYQHYKKFYNPSNAVLCLAGDFNTDQMISKIEQYYGSIPAGMENVFTAEIEPSIIGRHDVEVRGPGETTYLQLVYRAPAASDRNFIVFSVLDSLLTGPSGLNMFGGGSISNKTSRLYQKLVEAELAVGIGGGVQATREPYVYSINATIRPDKTVEDVLKVIDEEIDKLTNDSIQMDEIRRAVKQAKAMFVYGSENITNQAFWMGYAEMFASYDWFLEYLDNLESVKPEDILNVAHTYLHPDHRVIGKYIPDERAQSS